MKKLTVYIKPFKLEAVLDKLPREAVLEVCIAEARGYGRQKGHLEMYKQHEYELTFLPKARLEIYCEDHAVESVRDAILAAARTGRIGDGKIMVSDVEQTAEF